MININIFCFGFGQVAKSFINKVHSENIKFNLSTTSTSKTCKKSINKVDYQNFFLKNDEFDINLIKKLKEADHILVSIPPINGIDQVIKNFLKDIEDCKPKWVTYLSATSVYGDHKGEWVNEKNKTNPSTPNGVARLQAEKSWLTLGDDKNIPIQIFRLSGIYSNESNILSRLKSGNVKLVNKPNHFFSRIHVDDIANLLFKSLSKFKTREIYNITDDKPSPSQEVTLYGAKLLNIDKPKMIEVEEIESAMLKNFYKESKKVSNEKMKIFFSYNLKFPTYVEGLNFIKDDFV